MGPPWPHTGTRCAHRAYGGALAGASCPALLARTARGRPVGGKRGPCVCGTSVAPVWHGGGPAARVRTSATLAVRASWARERVHAQRVHCTAAARGRRRGERAPARSAAERHPTSAAQGGGESPKVHDRIRSIVAAGAAGATRSRGPCSDGQRLIVAAREAAAHHRVAVQPPAHRCSGCGGGHRGQLAVEGDPGLARPVTALRKRHHQ